MDLSYSLAFQGRVPGLSDVYDASKRHSEQSESIPQTFLDAMSVRERVYVDEQKVPLENEFDLDDPKSFLWVLYASSSGKELSTPLVAHSQAGHQIPVGTIRLVPAPHEHDEHFLDASLTEEEREAQGCMRKRGEAYAKLGRLAILQQHRKMGLSKPLFDAAIQYAQEHGHHMVDPSHTRNVSNGPLESWHGLILVHAQTSVERVWRKWGFVRDYAMGEWDEEGIMHIGMWKRLSRQPPEASQTAVVARAEAR